MTSNAQEIFKYKKKPFMRQVLLADANIPYKLSIDRRRNKLFFCINGDDFSDQSFYLTIMDLETGVPEIIQGIRNGYASAVDHNTGTVYLGGSNGIFKYDYRTSTIESLMLKNVDIFDMFFKDELYFVDTAKQSLSILRNNTSIPVKALKDCLIQHFVVDGKDEIYFVNSTGLHTLPIGSKIPTWFAESDSKNFRGAAVDMNGNAHFIGENGIYEIDKDTKQLSKLLPAKNGYGLTFDQQNNIIYSNERSIIKISHLDCNKDNLGISTNTNCSNT